jgi:hypothetical protein
MSWDIYGNPLQRGHCEVHPHVHEEYPCSVCLSERRQHDDANRDHQAQHDMILEVEYLKIQRDKLLTALEGLIECYCEAGGELSRADRAHHRAVYADAQAVIAKAKAGSENHSPGAEKKAVPKGWQLVPVEPTFDMKKSASKFQIGDDDLNLIDMSFEEIGCIYKAMLASAPKHEGGAS